VVEDGADPRPVAVITDTDIAAAVGDGKDPNEVRISDLPAREPITVASEETAAAAADVGLLRPPSTSRPPQLVLGARWSPLPRLLSLLSWNLGQPRIARREVIRCLELP
jgi:CBS domain-containing protein